MSRQRGGRAPQVVVLTGAGISADSGLATFRGAGGLWEGMRPEEVATPEAWARSPGLVWRFYQARREALLGVEPNAAHRALVDFAELLQRCGGLCTLVTQNVDDLHERAGSRPLHMHGELLRLKCESCPWSAIDRKHLTPEHLPCPACGAERLRPAVVWFGELPLHLEQIDAALAGCEHFLALGTSGLVYPAAGYLAQARLQGASTHVNSLDAPQNLEDADRFHPGRAVEVVPRLLAKLLQEWGLRQE